MEKREQLIAINDHITLIDDHHESTCYLVRGEKRALLIDTANGVLDLATLCGELTDLPVTVVNTHGHCDHVFGNIWFDQAYLHPADFALHDAHFQFPEIRALMAKTDRGPAQLLPLSPGMVFDLGALALEVLPMPGHTAGSVGLLSREDRILFSGDGANAHMWMQLSECLSIAALKGMLEKLLQNWGGAFDHILSGHGRGLEDAARVAELIEGCGELLRGEGEGDPPSPYYPDCLAHLFGPEHRSCLVYTREKL